MVGGKVREALFRRILTAVHQEVPAPTLYSNIYDLKRRTVHLYHFHNFENVVTFCLEDELRKGIQCYDLPSLFPTTFAAEQYREQKLDTMERIQKIGELTADVDLDLLDTYVGQYRTSKDTVITVTREDDRLHCHASWFSVDLSPHLGDSFSAILSPDMDMGFTFITDSSGEANALIISTGGDRTLARRMR